MNSIKNEILPFIFLKETYINIVIDSDYEIPELPNVFIEFTDCSLCIRSQLLSDTVCLLSQMF